MKLNRLIYLFIFLLCFILSTHAQVTDGVMFEVNSTTGGVLVPRMTSAQRVTIVTPTKGVMVFDIDTDGFWYFDGALWQPTAGGGTLADRDQDTKVQVEKNADEDVIRFNIAGEEKWRMTGNRLEAINANGGIYIGEGAGATEDTYQRQNIAIGRAALTSNLDRIGLIAIGDSALAINGFNITDLSHAKNNVAIGSKSLLKNLIGSDNTAVGHNALTNNTTGSSTTAIGSYALFDNQDGTQNTAIGVSALSNNTSGDLNTATGVSALLANTTGSHNSAFGRGALNSNTTGTRNTAVGRHALFGKTLGSYNTAMGNYAGQHVSDGDRNVIVGSNSVAFDIPDYAQSGSVKLGYNAGRKDSTDNVLHIANGDFKSLIYGDFDSGFVRIDGQLETTDEINIDNPGTALRVNGKGAIFLESFFNYFEWGAGGDYNYFNDNVRIGPKSNSTPVGNLHVADVDFTYITIESGASHDAVLTLTDDASAGNDAQWTMRRDDSDAGKFQWRHDNVARMTLTTAGDLGLGITSPNYQLHISGTAGKPGGGSWSNSSDFRLKKQINKYEDGLDEIMKIRPVRYYYNDKTIYDTSKEYVGVIAQELNEVTPYMVSTDQDGYLTVDNSAMTYMLINAVKELKQLNDQLLAENEDIKMRLSALEGR